MQRHIVLCDGLECARIGDRLGGGARLIAAGRAVGHDLQDGGGEVVPRRECHGVAFFETQSVYERTLSIREDGYFQEDAALGAR